MSEKTFFFFLSNFCLLEKVKKQSLLRINIINSTSRKLKNMILSINVAILTFVSFCLIFCNILGSVGMNMNFFYRNAIKIAGSAQKKTGSVGLAETQLCLGFMKI